MNDSEITAAREYLADLQERLGAAFAAEDGAAFVAEEWQSALGKGRGLRRENGAVFERAGINFSDIAGDSLPPAATARRPHLAGESYCAAGVSLVAHPQNPYCRRAHECAIFRRRRCAMVRRRNGSYAALRICKRLPSFSFSMQNRAGRH